MFWVITVDNSGKFSVLIILISNRTYHRNVRVFVKQVRDHRELSFKVLKVNVLDACNFVGLFLLQYRKVLRLPSNLCPALS